VSGGRKHGVHARRRAVRHSFHSRLYRDVLLRVARERERRERILLMSAHASSAVQPMLCRVGWLFLIWRRERPGARRRRGPVQDADDGCRADGMMSRTLPEHCRRPSNAAASIDEWRKTAQSKKVSAKQLRKQSRTSNGMRMVGPDRLRRLEGRDADSQRSGLLPLDVRARLRQASSVSEEMLHYWESPNQSTRSMPKHFLGTDAAFIGAEELESRCEFGDGL
jgi:hypothetical protein